MNARQALTQRLQGLHELVMAEDYAGLLELGPGATDPLVTLAAQLDEALTGGQLPPHQYRSHVEALLVGEDWLWHLADGGYSRLTVQIVDPERPLIAIDRGLSTARVVAAWDALARSSL